MASGTSAPRSPLKKLCQGPVDRSAAVRPGKAVIPSGVMVMPASGKTESWTTPMPGKIAVSQP